MSKLIIKCDYCSHFEDVQKGREMMIHEQRCCFNPANKKCYSCKHRDYEWDLPFCKVECNVTDGEEVGNCTKWEEDI